MKYLLPLLLFTSCITQRKVTRWNLEHPTQAAKYCADNFPPDTITRTETTTIDSTGYNQVNTDLQKLADSMLLELKKKTEAATPAAPYHPNIDSIRMVLKREIQKSIKPCVDSIKIVTHTIVDNARVKYLQGTIDEKDGTITKLQGQNAGLQDKLSAARKWVWWFWILVTAIGVYVFLKLKKFIP